MNQDFAFERHQGPFLALCPGTFGFLHTSPTRKEGVAIRELTLSPLGELFVPNGYIVAGDPFSKLKPEGNVRWQVPKGTHRVIQTMARVGEDDRLSGRRTAYMSLVFRPDLMEKRQAWQREQIASGKDPSIPEGHLSPMAPTLPDGSFSEDETLRMMHPDIPVFTGAMAWADALLFEDRMPLNRAEVGQGWLENLFDHGLEDSWFDRLDSDTPWPKGSSNHLLPSSSEDHRQANIAIFQTGWGDGLYRMIMESWQGEQVAAHVDFHIIPSDPMRQWREN